MLLLRQKPYPSPMEWIYIPTLFAVCAFLLSLFLVALSEPILLWRSGKIAWPNTFGKRVIYAGRFLTWVLWPMALMALGIKYLFELNN